VNFLAHCLIGQSCERAVARDLGGALIAGGFLGDFVKGRVPETMPTTLALGVRLHRRVDAFSNDHPGIRTSVRRFPPELRRLAPVLVDIMADHFLCQRWSDYHETSVTRFSHQVYAVTDQARNWLPVSGQRFLALARERDLLARYGEWQVTRRALGSIFRRLNQTHLEQHLEAVTADLLPDLQADFDGYFPDMVAHARDWTLATLR